jgi:Cu-Zn family superoxide dismutase
VFGRCEPPDFASAGGHFNPIGRVHGKHSTNGPHAGDLGNISVTKDGTGLLAFTTPHLNLSPGAATNPAAAGGLSIVIHADPDDERTDPSGNSGARIACGLLKLLPPPA